MYDLPSKNNSERLFTDFEEVRAPLITQSHALV